MPNLDLIIQPAQSLILESYLEENDNDLLKALAQWSKDLRLISSEMDILVNKFSNLNIKHVCNDDDSIQIQNVPDMVFNAVKSLSIVDLNPCPECGSGEYEDLENDENDEKGEEIK